MGIGDECGRPASFGAWLAMPVMRALSMSIVREHATSIMGRTSCSTARRPPWGRTSCSAARRPAGRLAGVQRRRLGRLSQWEICGKIYCICVWVRRAGARRARRYRARCGREVEERRQGSGQLGGLPTPPATARSPVRALCTGSPSREQGWASCLDEDQAPTISTHSVVGGDLPGVDGGGTGAPPD